MSKKIDREKYLSIGHLSSGYQNKTRDIPHLDSKGRPDGGKQTEHFNGRVDAHIKAKALKVELKPHQT